MVRSLARETEDLVFQLVALIGKGDLARRQLPAFAVSFVAASLFYKFGSFALECLAFLATWFLIDAAIQLVIGRREPDSAHAAGTSGEG
jgi:hypothetical protein